MPARPLLPLFASAAALILAAPAYALVTPANLITYVDATDLSGGNTRLADGGDFVATPFMQGDDQWSIRPFGNGGTVFTTNDFAPSEDAPGLVTLLDNLIPGQRYHVFAYLWSDHANWRLKASLTSLPPLPDDPAVSFSRLATALTTAAPPAVATDFDAPMLTFEGNRTFLQAALGVAEADANGEIQVWIDDYSGPNPTTGNRSWYDGLGYVAIPEPSSAALMTVGAIAAIRRRRR